MVEEPTQQVNDDDVPHVSVLAQLAAKVTGQVEYMIEMASEDGFDFDEAMEGFLDRSKQFADQLQFEVTGQYQMGAIPQIAEVPEG